MRKDATEQRLKDLIDALATLPGIGPRSAMRIAVDLLDRRRDFGREFVTRLTSAFEAAHRCPGCNTLTTEERCAICSDASRDARRICVVETPSDVMTMEESVSYQGRYFVLMGRVSPERDSTPEALGMDQLLARVREGVDEVIIATSYTPEGETTALLVTQVLRRHAPDVRVSRLARGLPHGVEVEFVDAATVAAAMYGRKTAG